MSEPGGAYVPGRFENAVLLAIYAIEKAGGEFPSADYIAGYIQGAGTLQGSVDADEVMAALIVLQAQGFVARADGDDE